MAQREVLGFLTADPAAQAKIGDSIHFSADPIFALLKANAVWLDNWGSPEGILLALQFRAKDHLVEGSAVMVAPGIAICATHVLEPHVTGLLTGETATLATAITSNGILIWRIHKVTMVPDSDLSILGLELASPLPDGNLFHQCRLSTRIPAEGESVLLLGFRAERPIEPGEQARFQVNGNVLACTGVVTKRYDEGRDKVFMPWPVMEVDCPSWGGMSGGPAFDMHGNLVGVLSSSFSRGSENGPSYISQVWPALTVQFEGGWPSGVFRECSSLLEMDPRLCAIDDRSVIEITRHKDGRTTTRLRLRK